jgi:hypothetical protein
MRIDTGKYPGPSRGTQRTGGVSPSKSDTGLGKLIDARGFQFGVPVAANDIGTLGVGHYEDEVRSRHISHSRILIFFSIVNLKVVPIFALA